MITKVYWTQENIKANLGTLMTANQVYNIKYFKEEPAISTGSYHFFQIVTLTSSKFISNKSGSLFY